jgi:alpha-tubulin suppressor-like RCC1 family protein
MTNRTSLKETLMITTTRRPLAARSGFLREASIAIFLFLLMVSARPALAQVAFVDPTVVQITAGTNHTCVLTSEGGVKCWGTNEQGQLGDGTTARRTTAVDVSGLSSGVQSIAAGGYHTCAVMTGGGVKCWGFNNLGQLGDGTTTDRSVPTDVQGLLTGVSSIGGGGYHTCAVTMAGGLKCWGNNGDGQLGRGIVTPGGTAPTPADVVGLTSGVLKVVGGGYHTCAVTTGGGLKCWGQNGGQIGDGTTTRRTTPVDVSGLSAGVTSVAATFTHTCAVTSSGGVKCWGTGAFAQVGDGSYAVPRLTPTDVVGLDAGVSTVSGGNAGLCAVTAAGGVACWGSTSVGGLRMTPEPMTTLTAGVVSSALGASHSCVLTSLGGVKCWGNNGTEQIGDATSDREPLPLTVRLGTSTASLGAGNYYTCAVSSSGGARCWGSNSGGQLGDGNLGGSRSTPGDVSGLTSGIKSIVGGGQSTCALTTAGGVKCWGYNQYGELGDGTTTPRFVPGDVTGLTNGVAALAGGSSQMCALTTGGGVKCWGNAFLGNGTSNSSSVPVDVTGLSSGVAAISIGGQHTCALLNSGQAKCWGQGNFGQLGDGTLTTRLTPVTVTALTDIVSLATGENFTCGVTSASSMKCWGGVPGNLSTLASGVARVTANKDTACIVTTADGVACWGSNQYGQLGDGTFSFRSTPVAVSGLSAGVTAVVLGYSHVCAVTVAGEVKCWGYNQTGSLGQGTRVDHTVPADVLGLSALAISIDNPSIFEGRNGSNILGFTVSLNRPSSTVLKFAYATADGTASSAANDYSPLADTLLIPDGSRSKTVTILAKGDTVNEANETFTLSLTHPLGTTVTRTGTILNDDPEPATTTVTQYRLYSDFTKEHLYTTDLNEYNVLGANNWIQEGVAYRMLTNGVYNGVAATIPMYRLYHAGILQHHWTTDSNEVIVLCANTQWEYEGVAGYLLPSQANGTVPLYRMSLASPPIHLWTTDLNEYDTLATRGWVKEGIIGYVVP